MKAAILSPKEFSGLTLIYESSADGSLKQTVQDSSETGSVPEKCKIFEFAGRRSSGEIADGFTPIDDLMAEWEEDPATRLEIEEARRWMAKSFHAEDGETVRTLRLKKGWSQAKLAEELSTSQSHIARIERGTENIALHTFRRLSEALGIDLSRLDQALRRQEELAEKT